MSRIVGFKTNRDFSRFRESLPKTTLTVCHRGPDDTGLFFDQNAGIGLAYAGHSMTHESEADKYPLSDEDGKIGIVCDGEIYNSQEIRNDLKANEHRFLTETDAELILKSYIQWGVDCLHRFSGAFAFALWDARTQKLFLARDHLGFKPLYYNYSSGQILFASELKSLMAFKDFPKEVDLDAVTLFLHYLYIPAPRTIFKDTFKLLPGHYAVLQGKRLTISPYWKLPNEDWKTVDSGPGEEDALYELDRILTRSVSARLSSDLPTGALLSGGIDSSLIVSLMQKVSKSSVKTFSIGFNEAHYNEAAWASKVAKYLGTDHTEAYVTPKEAMDVIPELPEIYDEPFADSSAVPTVLACRLARSQVDAALSGDGGDEQFCGYVRYWSTRAMATTFNRIPKTIKRPLGTALRKIPVSWVERCYLPLRPFLPQRFEVTNFVDKWQKLIRLLGESHVQELYRMTICLWEREELVRLTGRPLLRSSYEEAFSETEGLPILPRLMYVDQKTYLREAMLPKADRAGAAINLLLRAPLLDHRVMEFTSSLPDTLKYRNGTGKYLLRKLLARYLPRELFERPKMGFGAPINVWFRKDLKGLLLDYLSPERLKGEGLFDSHMVEEKITEHLSGEVNHGDRLWSILIWEMWRERWMQG